MSDHASARGGRRSGCAPERNGQRGGRKPSVLPVAEVCDDGTVRHDDLLDDLSALAPSPLRDAYLRFIADRGEAALRRDGGPEHVTGSCFVLSPGLDQVLLCFHRKGQFWVQFGGHVEETDASLAQTAQREAREESGIPGLTLLGAGVSAGAGEGFAVGFGVGVGAGEGFAVGAAAAAAAAAGSATSAGESSATSAGEESATSAGEESATSAGEESATSAGEESATSAGAGACAAEQTTDAPRAPIVDLDRHELHGGFLCAAHWDVGYVAVVAPDVATVVSDESEDVRWFPVRALPEEVPPGLALRIDAARRVASGLV